mmetsp:Transcript_35516/g.105000  ORF Transcript_35516/g.105000 Transcript_35516/m.105000 type:complete len:242 (+) Transcript_35516:271-996(+)
MRTAPSSAASSRATSASLFGSASGDYTRSREARREGGICLFVRLSIRWLQAQQAGAPRGRHPRVRLAQHPVASSAAGGRAVSTGTHKTRGKDAGVERRHRGEAEVDAALTAAAAAGEHAHGRREDSCGHTQVRQGPMQRRAGMPASEAYEHSAYEAYCSSQQPLCCTCSPLPALRRAQRATWQPTGACRQGVARLRSSEACAQLRCLCVVATTRNVLSTGSLDYTSNGAHVQPWHAPWDAP